MKFRLLILAAVSCFLSAGCGANYERGSSEIQEAGRDIRIVIGDEPKGLNPVLSTLSISRYVSEQIFQTLNALDPKDFSLRPALASLPVVDSLPSGGMVYRYRLDSAATWPNGSPVLASDVVFSLKVLLNPSLEVAGSYRHYYSMIEDIELDSTDNRSMRFVTKYPYLLATQAIGDLVIYPEYAYDPDGLMRSVSLTELMNADSADRLAKNSWEIQEFADRFKDYRFMYDPENIVGSGPYELVSWESNQKIRLARRDNYWAADRDEPWLVASPENLTFLIIPDNTTVTNALRDRLVDVVVDMPAEQFRDLRNDDYLRQFYDFSTIPGFKIHSILLNQSDPLMADSLTRRAFAHTVDVDLILNRLLPGLGERVNGPVLPTKPYYNHKLPNLEYDIPKAKRLLARAGWEDRDGDGIVEKFIDGERRKFSINLLSSTRPSSVDLALVVAESSRQAGIDINVIKLESTSLLQKLSSGDFVASIYGQVYDPIPDDFSQVWYSTSVPPSGTNRGYFSNPEVDSLIEEIKQTTDAESRRPLYLRFQEIIYENQPMVFLYSPFDRVVVSNLLDYNSTSLAPNLNFNALRAAERADATRVTPNDL